LCHDERYAGIDRAGREETLPEAPEVGDSMDIVSHSNRQMAVVWRPMRTRNCAKSQDWDDSAKRKLVESNLKLV